MSASQFISGQWVGFYNYSSRPKKYLMDLLLEFRNGAITGEGADGLGIFVISGAYSERDGECTWNKTYVGNRTHTVAYRGFGEKKGIWGTWTLPRAKGGFHIWPLSDGAPLPGLEEEKPEELPLVAPERK
ncbi:MAG TPA: hypothetical protein VG733_00935 [Chthoniobacteraceae bacterium]|nr:hypothetical protein [Chthoniobacteraceae bacterium]